MRVLPELRIVNFKRVELAPRIVAGYYFFSHRLVLQVH